MEIPKIEQMIKDCKTMSSNSVFNLENGFVDEIDHQRYAELLEGLLRKYLVKVEQ